MSCPCFDAERPKRRARDALKLVIFTILDIGSREDLLSAIQ